MRVIEPLVRENSHGQPFAPVFKSQVFDHDSHSTPTVCHVDGRRRGGSDRIAACGSRAETEDQNWADRDEARSRERQDGDDEKVLR